MWSERAAAGIPEWLAYLRLMRLKVLIGEIIANTVVSSIGWSTSGQPMEGAKMQKDKIEGLIAAVLDRFDAGEISSCQAMEEIQAIALAAETVSELELTEKARESLED